MDADYADPLDMETMINKIRLIMRAACHNNADTVVLGPLGSGAFKNPMLSVAEAMRRVLIDDLAKENWLAAGITRVIVAIDDDTGKPKWYAFNEKFKDQPGVLIDIKGFRIYEALYGFDSDI